MSSAARMHPQQHQGVSSTAPSSSGLPRSTGSADELNLRRSADELQRLLSTEDSSSRQLAANFLHFASVCARYTKDVSDHTAQMGDVMAQAASYMEFNSSESTQCSDSILLNLQKLSASSNEVKALINQVRALNELAAVLEAKLMEMEAERGLVHGSSSSGGSTSSSSGVSALFKR